MRRPEHPWFGPKRFGFGWRPISREGWVVSIIYLLLVFGVLALGTIAQGRTGADPSGLIASAVAVLSVGLLVVCFLTSGPPRWR